MKIPNLFSLFTLVFIYLSSPEARCSIFGPDAYLVVDDLRGLQKTATVEWKGANIGKATVVGMENGKHRVDLSIEAKYFSNVHSDVRFVLDSETGRIRLVGGDTNASPPLPKGAQILELPKLATQATQAAKNVLGNAIDGVKGFTKGVAGNPEGSSTEENKPVNSNKKPLLGLDWFGGGPDVILLGNLEDISPGALVKWQGGTIGKVVKITTEGAGGRADVQLSSGYQGKLRNDARFAVEKGTPVAVKIIGGTDPVAPPLAKGATLRQQTAEELGTKAGVIVRGLIKQGVDATRDAVKTVEEEVKKQSQKP